MKKCTLFLFFCMLLLVDVNAQKANSAKIQNDEKVEKKISSYTQLLIKQWEKNQATQSKTDQAPTSSNQDDGNIENQTEPEIRGGFEKIVDFDKTFIIKDEDTYLKGFIRLAPNGDVAILEQHGVKINANYQHLASALIPYDSLDIIVQLTQVKGIEASRPVYMTLDSVRRCSNINDIHAGINALPKAYKGSGVIVGVVDRGFDFTHPNFYDVTGTNYRIKKVWNQRASTGTPPIGYSLGAEYTTPSSIQAIKTDYTDGTHGTHTSGIAAGSGYTTNYSGIAPESDLILVATDMSTTGIMDGIAYIADNARKLNMPCVINLSLGSEIGPHDGSGIPDLMMDSIAGPGIIMVGAAGNSGADSIHIQKIFADETTQSIKTFLSPTSNGTTEMLADIWERKGKNFHTQVSIFDTKTGKIITETQVIESNQASKEISLSTGNNEYYIDFENQLYPGNNNYNTLIYISASTSFSTDEAIVITVSSDNSNVINMWATNAYFRNNQIKEYIAGDTDYTVGSIGGVGKKVISVGAYCTKTKWETVRNTQAGYSMNYDLYQIAYFSSKGPTADGRMKPDIAAPGFGVVSSFNSFNSSYGASNARTVTSAKFNSRQYYWGINQGTSMSAPVVAGIIALWLEANPNLTPDMIRTIFSQNSFEATDITRSLSQNNVFGWGKINGLAGLKESIALNNEPVRLQIEDDIYVLPYPEKNSFLIQSKKNLKHLWLTDLSGRIIKKISIPNETHDYPLSVENLIQGIYLLKADYNGGSRLLKIFVE